MLSFKIITLLPLLSSHCPSGHRLYMKYELSPPQYLRHSASVADILYGLPVGLDQHVLYPYRRYHHPGHTYVGPYHSRSTCHPLNGKERRGHKTFEGGLAQLVTMFIVTVMLVNAKDHPIGYATLANQLCQFPCHSTGLTSLLPQSDMTLSKPEVTS